MIKVRMGGTRSGRWINFAAWWWETNRGPVPEGKRVAHLDGDALNDDPSNLELLSAGDVVFLWHDRDPKNSARNYAACRKGTAAFNRDRAFVRRQTEWLPSKWYAVDVEGKRIFDEPYRKRNQAMTAHGMSHAAAAARSAIPESLGWKDVSAFEACVLAVLVNDNRSLDRVELFARVKEFRERRAWMPFDLPLHVFYCSTSRLRRRGYMVVRRRGRHLATYHVGRAAIEARGPVCPVAAISGAELQEPRFHDFVRTETPPPVAGYRRSSDLGALDTRADEMVYGHVRGLQSA